MLDSGSKGIMSITQEYQKYGKATEAARKKLRADTRQVLLLLVAGFGKVKTEDEINAWAERNAREYEAMLRWIVGEEEPHDRCN